MQRPVPLAIGEHVEAALDHRREHCLRRLSDSVSFLRNFCRAEEATGMALVVKVCGCRPWGTAATLQLVQLGLGSSASEALIFCVGTRWINGKECLREAYLRNV
jgi:hypothetical protein